MINHVGTVDIFTNRLLLRKFSLNDAQNMFDNWANDEQVTKYLSWKPHGNIENTKNWINTLVNLYLNLDTYNWAIVIKENSQVIGSISIVKLFEKDSRCEIGYCISRQYWNKGIMTETLKAIIKFCIIDLEINRVEAFHHINNIISGKVMIKAGMKYEGRLRQYIINNQNEYVDCDMYSILKEDYVKSLAYTKLY